MAKKKRRRSHIPKIVPRTVLSLSLAAAPPLLAVGCGDDEPTPTVADSAFSVASVAYIGFDSSPGVADVGFSVADTGFSVADSGFSVADAGFDGSLDGSTDGAMDGSTDGAMDGSMDGSADA